MAGTGDLSISKGLSKSLDANANASHGDPDDELNEVQVTDAMLTKLPKNINDS